MEIFVEGRLSFPDLFKRGLPPKDRPTEPGRYGLQLIIEKDSPAHHTVRDAMLAVAKEQWKENFATILKALETNKKCLRDGDKYLDKNGAPREEYTGKVYLRATNGNAVPIIAAKAKKADGSWNYLTEADGKPYSGCYVKAKVDVYAMTKHGNAINATLLAVQFVRDGDAFGGAVASPEGFDDVPGATDDSDLGIADDDIPF